MVLLGLPDDVFCIICGWLLPKDICNLSVCCRSLLSTVVANSDKLWLTQCNNIGFLPLHVLFHWRNGVSSYKALCRFLVSVNPLIGIWVHQNPELGNVVYVMPGFLSVVGCRIIPQELGPEGIHHGPLLWAPVFEILADFHGSTVFFLHGREKGNDFIYPGSVKNVDHNCNVLLLEVEPRQHKKSPNDVLLHSKSFAYNSDNRNISTGLSRSQRVLGHSDSKVPFSRLAYSDRRKLIEVVTSQVRRSLPDLAIGPLFSRLRSDGTDFHKDVMLLVERRTLLLQMYELGGSRFDWKEAPADPFQLQLGEIKKSFDRSNGFYCSNADSRTKSINKKTLGGYFRASLRQILGKSPSINGSFTLSKNTSSSSENKHAQLHEFLRSGDTIGLTLHASTARLSSYRAWPNMHDSRFALYKLPIRVPRDEQEYAGLWGGTFGWPPGKPNEDKPGKALFFLLISYDEHEGQRQLIATKILEGTHYVLHPNGSAMFIVNMDEPSLDPFPWDVDADSIPVNVNQAFAGEGIANGYGFRYPGSKPGSLFVLQDGLLAFIWKESRAVLTMQRLNLQELLRKGERVPALPPIANFAYLTKSYSNVFAGFSNTSACLASPRERQ
ncbi:F-box family protein [Euphorbia peplus]|nr:F-box family protein [Euphorbia peplus]